MPGRTVTLRRSRSAIETEEDADSVRAESQPSSAGSDSVKRARVNGNRRDIGTSGHLSSSNATSQRSRQIVKGGRNSRVNGAAESEDGGFQTGAIVRVKVTNFVTYENAEFFPGPNLNMVIGPNGTGKSSLVCAICLGLGWGPAQLGRASSFGEFVKHGAKEAIVEIELQGEPDEDHNTIVKVRITRENNKREWWLNNRSTGHKAVQAKMEKLNVQIGNLCQFLPQDKVSEFAAMKPVELLEATQQAAAPPQMRIWHDDLKRLRKEQKMLQIQNEEAQDTLANLEGRQQNLRAEVEKLQKRKEIQHRITLLERAIPLGEYSIALKHFNEFKKKRKEAEIQLRKLEQEVEPLMRSVNQKQQYKRQIDIVFAERKAAVLKVEREADALSGEIERLDEDIKGNDVEVAAQKENDAKRKQARQTFQQNIREHEIKLQRGEPEFDPKKWNTMISDKEREERAIEAEMQELGLQNNQFKARGREIIEEQTQAKEQLDSLDTQSGRQNTKLEQVSGDTAKLWKWVQQNMTQFEKEVFGPPMVTCSVKDPRYANAVEALFPQNALLTITTQTYNDNVKLGKCIKTFQLAEVRLAISGNGNVNPPFSTERLQELGLDAWAVDLIEGPQPVISMLFGGSASQAVGLRDISDSQYERILQTRAIPRYVARDQLCITSYRSEYNQSSTQHRHISAAKFWVDTPVDQSARREIEAKMQALSKEFSEIKDEKVKPLQERIEELKEQRTEVKKEIKEIKDKKSAEQVAHGKWETLPNKIARFEESLRENDLQGEEFRERMKNISIKYDNEVLKRAQLGLQHKKLVASIRSCHEDLLEAAIRQIEADSDIESLKERNADNDRRLQEERQRMREAADESKSHKEKAAKALEVAQAIIADSTEEDVTEIKTYAHEKTLEELANETAAEKSKLELIHTGNPNAIREFEKRQSQLEELEAKIQVAGAELERLDEKITNIRSQWEPEIDRIVAEISEAFALNFETIGCNGEVSVHKDDDFDLWSIEIKVKFRENETLQLLDAHRQSGGERSVSTIFYLMALQSLAKSPFRVVDEINQGMDPRNERMVHERMVQIACQEHTSQYFLITPKLLTGLRYDKRMKVLCIASGEYMPEDYKTLDVSKIIRKRKAMIAAR